MGLIVSIVVGGIVGWVASIIMKTDAQMGILANIAVGILGSMLGHWLAGMVGMVAYGGVVRWLVGIGGAVLLIVILKALNILQ